MNLSQISGAESDGNSLCTDVTARSSLSGNPNNRRAAGAAEVSGEGKGHRDLNVSKRARSPRNGALGNNAWVLDFVGVFVFDWEPLKTAANGFQNILHLFIAKRADHEVCGGHNTKKNYNLREGKAVKI